MPKQIIIAEQYRTAAVFSEDQIEEIIVGDWNPSGGGCVHGCGRKHPYQY